MTASARSGWRVTSIRMLCDAYTVGIPNGAYSAKKGYLPAYCCQACNGYDTLLTGTVFAKTRRPPATKVLLLRGIAKGESTARLARGFGISGKQLHTLWQRIQAHVNATAPTDATAGPLLRPMNATRMQGEKSMPHRDPCDPPRRCANKRKRHSTYANARPPMSV
jgi:hypothetical protein